MKNELNKTIEQNLDLMTKAYCVFFVVRQENEITEKELFVVHLLFSRP